MTSHAAEHRPLQPLLHDSVALVAAPTQAVTAPSGDMDGAAHGVYHSDRRVIGGLRTLVGGIPLESISRSEDAASSSTFSSLARHVDDAGADPRVRVDATLTVRPGAFSDAIRLSSALGTEIETTVSVEFFVEFTPMQRVKSGHGSDPSGAPEVVLEMQGAGLLASSDGARATIRPGGAEVSFPEPAASARVGVPVRLSWPVVVPAGGSVEIGWEAAFSDEASVVGPAGDPAPWAGARVEAGDSRLGRWVDRALGDLSALRMTTTRRPGDAFLAAGAPWFFTLFGRDSIWAARFLLPFDTATAASTLRVLASLQGRTTDPATAEQPGKIMHELRQGSLSLPGEGVELPPLYYGTIDATALWICLLHDAWRWGMPDEEVRELLPALRAALDWMREHGDSDGDGFLEYVDESGHGLANQGWKDSGDSVQWHDGRLADGPIALCEVQAYAFEAARGAADILDAFGEDGADAWRAWADALAVRFRAAFWVDGPAGRHPAIALDADKRAVDSLTSNIGHLLGTGILDAEEEAVVASLLVSPQLDSGFGLRTMSTGDAGYWPLSYHGGSVWAHDTAIAVHGLARAGFREEAARLSRGLLAAAERFDYRMPELHAGDDASTCNSPAPYPAACRPQAWSAAASVVVASAAVDLRPGPDGVTASPLVDEGLGRVVLSGVVRGGRRLEVVADTTSATVTSS